MKKGAGQDDKVRAGACDGEEWDLDSLKKGFIKVTDRLDNRHRLWIRPTGSGTKQRIGNAKLLGKYFEFFW